jgi:hypothetical protein
MAMSYQEMWQMVYLLRIGGIPLDFTTSAQFLTWTSLQNILFLLATGLGSSNDWGSNLTKIETNIRRVPVA